jgi:hypothetical protein
MQEMGDWARYYSRPDIYQIDFIHASFVNHAFSRHVHDYFAVLCHSAYFDKQLLSPCRSRLCPTIIISSQPGGCSYSDTFNLSEY